MEGIKVVRLCNKSRGIRDTIEGTTGIWATERDCFRLGRCKLYGFFVFSVSCRSILVVNNMRVVVVEAESSSVEA